MSVKQCKYTPLATSRDPEDAPVWHVSNLGANTASFLPSISITFFFTNRTSVSWGGRHQCTQLKLFASLDSLEPKNGTDPVLANEGKQKLINRTFWMAFSKEQTQQPDFFIHLSRCSSPCLLLRMQTWYVEAYNHLVTERTKVNIRMLREKGGKSLDPWGKIKS